MGVLLARVRRRDPQPGRLRYPTPSFRAFRESCRFVAEVLVSSARFIRAKRPSINGPERAPAAQDRWTEWWSRSNDVSPWYVQSKRRRRTVAARMTTT